MKYDEAKKLGTKVFWMNFLYYPYFVPLIIAMLIVMKYEFLVFTILIGGGIIPYIYYAKQDGEISKYLDRCIDTYEENNGIEIIKPFNRKRYIYNFLCEELKCSKDQIRFEKMVETACKNIKYRIRVSEKNDKKNYKIINFKCYSFKNEENFI